MGLFDFPLLATCRLPEHIQQAFSWLGLPTTLPPGVCFSVRTVSGYLLADHCVECGQYSTRLTPSPQAVCIVCMILAFCHHAEVCAVQLYWLLVCGCQKKHSFCTILHLHTMFALLIRSVVGLLRLSHFISRRFFFLLLLWLFTFNYGEILKCYLSK